MIGGIYVAASAVTENNRVQQAQKQMVTMIEATRALYATQPYYTYLPHDQLKATGIMPADAQDNGTIFLNPWGGQVEIGDTTNNNQQGFSIHYAGIPTDACIKLATNMLSNKNAAVYAFMVNTTYILMSNPVPIATIADLCRAQSSNYLGINVLLH